MELKDLKKETAKITVITLTFSMKEYKRNKDCK